MRRELARGELVAPSARPSEYLRACHPADPVSHMRDPVSHMRDPVSHMRDPVSHMRETVSHMRTLCAHGKWRRGCSIIVHSRRRRLPVVPCRRNCERLSSRSRVKGRSHRLASAPFVSHREPPREIPMELIRLKDIYKTYDLGEV